VTKAQDRENIKHHRYVSEEQPMPTSELYYVIIIVVVVIVIVVVIIVISSSRTRNIALTMSTPLVSSPRLILH